MAKKQNKEIKDWDYIAAYVKREEGFRSNVYKDNLGFWTVGVGHGILKQIYRRGRIFRNLFLFWTFSDQILAKQMWLISLVGIGKLF